MKKNDNYKWIIGFIIGALLAIPLVYAVTKYASSEVLYDNTSSSLTSADVQGAVDELANKYNGVFNCPIGKTCFDKPPIKLGDYVSMTPTLTSAITDTTYTGYEETQTFNPQELNLWRVISVNDDGTVDIISEYTSSTSIYFSGTIGYRNFVGYLNDLASKYENSTYTKRARHFGYSTQTNYIKSMTTSKAPWTCSTGGSCNPVESKGGGDELYEKDYNLVDTILGIKATKINGSTSDYWISSRRYYYKSSTYYYWELRKISSNSNSIDSEMICYYLSKLKEKSSSATLRPILTLKFGLKYSGSGTNQDPWQLSV